MATGTCQNCNTLNDYNSMKCKKCGALFSKLPLAPPGWDHIQTLEKDLKKEIDEIKSQNILRINKLQGELDSIRLQTQSLEEEKEMICNTINLLHKSKFTNVLSVIDKIEDSNIHKSMILSNVETNNSLENILKNYRNKHICISAEGDPSIQKYVIVSVSNNLFTLKNENKFIHIPFNKISSIIETENAEIVANEDIFSKEFNMHIILKSTVVNNYIENRKKEGGGGVGAGVGVLFPIPFLGE